MSKINRVPLKDRPFPDYTEREEKLNSLSHTAGIIMAVAMMVLTMRASIQNPSKYALFSGIVYSLSIILMFSVSAIYHGLPKSMAKQVMRVIDHCNIFLTIVGCYTPIMLVGVLPVNPAMAWSVLATEVVMAIIGITLNAIDLKKFSKFSMVCYIAMGWCVIISLKDTVTAMTWKGFFWILAGGVSYTAGALVYLSGKRNHRQYRHFIFHIFIIVAVILQFIGIYGYLLR